MQHAYEDRIAALRADIDRLTSRQLLNQEEVEAEVEKVLARQSAISQRQELLGGVTAAARAAGFAVPPGSATVAAPPATAASASPPTSTPKPGVPAAALKTSAILVPSLIGPAEAKETTGSWKPPLAQMSAVKTELDRIADAQVAYVSTLSTTIAKRNDALAAVLKSMGREVPEAKAPGNVGGPYVPVAAVTDPALFISSVDWLSGEIERYTAIHYLAIHLPVTTPLPDPSVTSGFGTRIDPFLGTPALHPGIDYRASLGTPVAATAPGTVIDTQTGYNGGYGNMVDIDHGNGIVTRFAHLSAIDVKVGQVVAKGTTIGKAGATGRATGPHLHYEVRVDDEAIDPTRFISVGEKLLPLL